jgi:hypothetical protein
LIFSGLCIKTSAAICDPSGSHSVKLSIFNQYARMYVYKVEYERMCYVKEYISEYKPTEVYDISLVRVYSVLKECYLVLLWWSVASGRLRF